MGAGHRSFFGKSWGLMNGTKETIDTIELHVYTHRR